MISPPNSLKHDPPPLEAVGSDAGKILRTCSYEIQCQAHKSPFACEQRFSQDDLGRSNTAPWMAAAQRPSRWFLRETRPSMTVYA